MGNPWGSWVGVLRGIGMGMDLRNHVPIDQILIVHNCTVPHDEYTLQIDEILISTYIHSAPTYQWNVTWMDNKAY